jgi:hypothetical protein
LRGALPKDQTPPGWFGGCQLSVGNGCRPCENGWWRGFERRRCLRFRLQEPGVFQPLWWLDGSRVRAVRTSNGGTALEAT